MFGFTTWDSQGVEYTYTRPLMQTFLMFLAMSLALPLYYGYLFFSGSAFPRVKRSMWCVSTWSACVEANSGPTRRTRQQHHSPI